MGEPRMRKGLPEPHIVTLFLVLPVLVIAGCAVGPTYDRPETTADRADSYVNVRQEQPVELADLGLWWERFGDSQVQELVETALRGNLDLKLAAARVLESEALFAVARGGRFPQVGYGLDASRVKNSFVLPTVGRTNVISTTFGHDLSASYQVDLFRKLSKTQEAAWTDLLANKADQEALYHTIIASVVRSRIRIAKLAKQLALTKANTESRRSTLEIVERRYVQGLTSSLDVRLARENLAASQASEYSIEEQLRITSHGLDVLLGIQPGTGAVLPETLPALPDLEPVPHGIPAAILDQRPDIRSAELRLMSATTRVGIAMADLFPSLTLTGSAGIVSDEFKNLFSTDGFVYSLIANLVTPLFTGGKLRAQVKAAEARVEQATAAYSKVILNALREVEDALVREEFSRQRLFYLKTRMEEALAAETLARTRYQQGLERLLVVLETERRRRLAETELILTESDLWNARVDLFLALGGDWKIEIPDPGKKEMTASEKQVSNDIF